MRVVRPKHRPPQCYQQLVLDLLFHRATCLDSLRASSELPVLYDLSGNSMWREDERYIHPPFFFTANSARSLSKPISRRTFRSEEAMVASAVVENLRRGCMGSESDLVTRAMQRDRTYLQSPVVGETNRRTVFEWTCSVKHSRNIMKR